ncbi:MAG: hypothetical protein WCW77_01200 [Patescibacteria group bacterium]|jgi:hypothetical protein
MLALLFAGVVIFLFFIRRYRIIAKENKRREKAWADDHEIRAIDWDAKGILVITLASGKTVPVSYFQSWAPLDYGKRCLDKEKYVSLEVAEGGASRRVRYSISKSAMYSLEKSLPMKEFGSRAKT